MRCPCKDCFRRTLTCHGFCDDYKAWKEWKEEVNKQKAADAEVRQISRNHEMKYRKSLKKGG